MEINIIDDIVANIIVDLINPPPTIPDTNIRVTADGTERITADNNQRIIAGA